MSDLDTGIIIDTAIRSTKPAPLADGFEDGQIAIYSVVTPMGSTVHVLDTEEQVAKYRDRPRRKKGVVILNTPASLAQYVNAHAGEGTVLYGDWERTSMTAVLNDHDDAAGWGDHRAVLVLRHTPEWKRWLSRNGMIGDQVAFAEHIEECAADVVDPDAATLLEVAQTFEAHKTVAFKSGTRLADGNVQFRYEETTTARAGQVGNIEIPTSFLLKLAIFEGMDGVEIGARLRFRIADGQLRIGYILDRPEVAVREAVEHVIATVEAATKLTALRGTPRS